MWTPDVYEGSPKAVTAFLASAPKVAAVAVMMRFLYSPLGDHSDVWVPLLVITSAASMLWGALAALRQDNIKRLIAYSSIGHMGYMLMGLAGASAIGLQSAVLYIALYVLMTLGTFSLIMVMKRKGEHLESIGDLTGLSRNHPLLAAGLAVLMLSMAGVPPMAGFFAKFYVLQAALDARLYTLAVIGVLASVIGAFYYLRIIKVMYFDEGGKAFDRDISAPVRVLFAVMVLVNLLFFLVPNRLIEMAGFAADMLL